MTAATVSGADLVGSPAPRAEPTYSVVIPVFNGAEVVTATVDGCVSFFEARGLRHELVLVDDGSTDAPGTCSSAWSRSGRTWSRCGL